uniref:SDR family oxidoreductase n=1 Tax=Noctiluca scintillans TaxID=2966 RepID=A0A7S1AMT0_NOCSC
MTDAQDTRPVAIVTGGTRGIGRGTSEALADEGFDLLLGYGTNAEAAETAASELRERGARVVVVGGDVSEEATVVRYFEVFQKEFPSQQLRAVVHNAGQYMGLTAANNVGVSDGAPRLLGSLLLPDGSVDFSRFDYYHQIYARAWVQLVERAVPFLTVGGGSVIGISSPGCNATQVPAGGYDMPGSAKTVMETTARFYAKNLAHQGITVNVVIPGVTLSDAWIHVAKGRGMAEDHTMAKEVAERAVPLGRAQSCRELGDVVAFLCSSRGKYITGVALPVDGGLHLGKK